MRYTISRTLDYEIHRSSFDRIISHISGLCKQWPTTPQIEQELEQQAQTLVAELVKWLHEIGWFLTGHDADLGLTNRCLDACSDALQAVERAVPEEIFDKMCTRRLTIQLFGEPTTMVYDMEVHLDDHMVWFWRELIVRAVVPRTYYVSHKEIRQDIIENIAKHDRSSLVYDSIHDIRTDGWHGWGDQMWMAHWSEEMRRHSKPSLELHNRAAGIDARETLVFVGNP
ncbi:hypothetical protein IW261DRAFT_87984 [Armillaria novae-zelandiae]|uniref:Uncharacterized protein n=1 Tax=Armillaria novae-zelandiae TaxID=153914 RepID=A0AA39PVP0_9AGAR|nr:hypothetical protein IW261DRAFT_87984 [Armillaria novae-zelandiae]